jgi:hypothetical protein
MRKVFVSDAIHRERLIFEPPQLPAGQGPRGWNALSALYQASLAACRYQIEHVVRPEIYQSDRAREIRGVKAGDWHLAVKPIEHLRPFHGIPNVFVCNWPFPELSAEPLGGFPFFDHVRLLKMATAVLCCTDFTANTLRDAGVKRAITLPPHISPPCGRAASSPARERCCFLCVVDSDHLPRQLGPTIEGFAQAATKHSRLHLNVCLQGASDQVVADLRQRAAQMTGVAAPDEIISIVDAGAANKLWATADFFLCADSAPGLHLPLVEAMLAGIPVVTTMNAGTASFLPPNAAVPVTTHSKPFDGDDEPIGCWLPLTSNPPTAESVRDAILSAVALDETARTRMAATGRAIAERRFGFAAFMAGVAQLDTFVSPAEQ